MALESRSSKTPQLAPAISYRLSDRYFLDIGWTSKLKGASVVPVVVMKAKFSKPVISPWFKPRLSDLEQNYENGKTLFKASANETGEIYYPNGRLAIRIEKGGLNNFRTRVWVYSPGESDLSGAKQRSQLCALFDSIGNGVVYDSSMRQRLMYNQSEGIYWSSPSGLPVIWKWHTITYEGSLSSMNEEDEKHKVIEGTPKRIISANPVDGGKPLSVKEVRVPSKPNAYKTTSSLTMPLAQSEIDFRNNIENWRYLNTSKIMPKRVSPVKPIVLRINKYLALRVYNQSEISLRFIAGTHQTTLQLGVLYNPYDKLKVVEMSNMSFGVDRVICAFENFPPKTESMMKLKKLIQKIRAASLKEGGGGGEGSTPFF